jgi:signal transduction histidine kinase
MQIAPSFPVEDNSGEDALALRDQSKLLNVQKLTRYFGEIGALVGVSFEIERGEVLGVVGMAGAGKTTLFNLLSGVDSPSSGNIFFAGTRVQFSHPAQAQQLGIETIHQGALIDENVDALRNVFLGREIFKLKALKIWPDKARMECLVRELLNSFDLPLELIHAPASNLTNEQKQVIAVARGLCRPSQLLLLDNPLAVLSYERQQILINHIRELAAQNVSVILCSDDLKHIFAVTDRILVLYQGSQVSLQRTADTTPREIVELMVGSSLHEQVTPVIWAFENYHAAQQQAEELRNTQLELRQNLEVKDSLNRQLVVRLQQQVQALDRLNLALQEANRRLMTEREAERKSLARELHDQVIQDLLSYSYQLEGLEQDVTDDDQSQNLAKIRTGIRSVASSLRQVCSDLRPPTIDSQGLSAAIHSLIYEWSASNGVDVQLEIDPQLGRMPEYIELSVFRIIQEGFSNVRKHANATKVKLTLQRTSTASLVVKLCDNGQGTDKPIDLAALSKAKHYGLVGISERVSLLSGTMKVSSQASNGLELWIEIPSPSPFIEN